MAVTHFWNDHGFAPTACGKSTHPWAYSCRKNDIKLTEDVRKTTCKNCLKKLKK